MRITCIIALAAAIAALGGAPPAHSAAGDSLVGLPALNPGGGSGIIYPLQGDPASFPMASVPVQRDAATISYPGITDANNLLQVYDDCVYIDNQTNMSGPFPESYFVPLRTRAEWTAFKANLPPHVTLTGGCPPALNLSTPLGPVDITTPARYGAVVTISLTDQQTAHMQCVAPQLITQSCGAYAFVEYR